MEVKEDFFKRGSFIVGDGMRTCFWEDIWLGDTSLAPNIQTCITLSELKNVMIADVLTQVPLDIRFD
jgi:hypothetical protein